MSGQRILVVDDEPQIHRFLKPALEVSGYQVLRAMTGAEAQALAASHRPDLVILDLGLPDCDGKAVIAPLKAIRDVPVIVLSARDQEPEKVAALDHGADDYVEKPFGIAELLARIRTALRRAAPPPGTRPMVFGPVSIDTVHRVVQREGQEVHLTPKEYDLLLLLARRPGGVVTHRQLLTEVWGPAHRDDVQYLRVAIGHLRGKLEADPAEPRLILTEPAIGYRFAAE
jgi:two-component system KDP operon response regulator KdpE